MILKRMENMIIFSLSALSELARIGRSWHPGQWCALWLVSSVQWRALIDPFSGQELVPLVPPLLRRPQRMDQVCQASHHGTYFVRIIFIFSKSGANLESEDRNNNTPLHLAAKQGHEGVVQVSSNTFCHKMSPMCPVGWVIIWKCFAHLTGDVF